MHEKDRIDLLEMGEEDDQPQFIYIAQSLFHMLRTMKLADKEYPYSILSIIDDRLMQDKFQIDERLLNDLLNHESGFIDHLLITKT